MASSIPSDVPSDKCVDRFHTRGTWFVRWVMRFLASLAFCAPFRNCAAPDFRTCRRPFRAHASTSKWPWMDSRTSDCVSCRSDSSQSCAELMHTPSRVHCDLAHVAFHGLCSRPHEVLGYLFGEIYNKIRYTILKNSLEVWKNLKTWKNIKICWLLEFPEWNVSSLAILPGWRSLRHRTWWMWP